MIHDGSSSPPPSWHGGRVREGASGEPARRQACRSRGSAIAIEALVNHAGEIAVPN
jgi:hypothetical protein